MADFLDMAYTDHAAEVMDVMTERGLLLATWKGEGVANAMTIGWGMIGSIWSRMMWQVLVRPSRYTYELLEDHPLFSVNVLPKSLSSALALCGSRSGRDGDKLAEAGLTTSAGPATGAPVIDQSVISYECHVVHTNDFLPERMVPDIREGCYPSGDYHRVYWGQIIGSRVKKEALGTLF